MKPLYREALLGAFPKGAAIPKALEQLYDYAHDRPGLLLVGDLGISASLWTSVDDWFEQDEKMVARFIGFATDRFRSIYGYWLHDGVTDVAKAPIGYLSAESKCENTVLASDLPELLSLLTIGARSIGEVDAWEHHLEAHGKCRDLAAYRRWAKKSFGIEPLPDFAAGRALVARARAAHPDMQEWTNAWVRRGRRT